VADTAVRQLPRGRHGLSRERVEVDQRLRIFLGMTDAMAERGYIGTPVAEIIKRAGVSRETFYQLYDDKLDAFLAAFDLVGAVVVERIEAATAGDGEPMARVERAVTAYLETLVEERGFARLFLVEVHAAGPEAMARRAAIQERIVDALAELLGAHSDVSRFAAQLLVAAVGAMVTGPLVAGDVAALRALGPPVIEHVRLLVAAGVFTGRDGAKAPRR
jgi:AcrR family transcriptional regulator